MRQPAAARMPLRPLPALALLALLLALALMLWPLAHAVWLSFTPGELLEGPQGDWSLRWYRTFFDSPRWTGGLLNSAIVAALSVALSVLLGTGLAAGLAGLGRHRSAQQPRHRALRALADGFIALPLLLPPVVLAMALLPAMRLLGLWGAMLSVAIGHSLLALPVVYIVVRDALAGLDPDLALAARGLGASRRRAFVTVVLPLLAPAIAFGALTAFVLSLNEFVIALFLATPAIETLPKVIWPNLRYTLTPLVAAASAITLAISVLAIAAVTGLRRWQRLRTIRARR